jgi:hypothetical protein
MKNIPGQSRRHHGRRQRNRLRSDPGEGEGVAVLPRLRTHQQNGFGAKPSEGPASLVVGIGRIAD